MVTFPVIAARGSARQMGRQHGELAGNLIQGYLRLIERITGTQRDVLCRRATAFLPPIRALSPLFVEEVRGLAEGASISFEEALLCQVRAEARDVSAEGCTAFALRGEATADGNVLAGQNQDLSPEFLDVSIVLRVEPNDGRPRALLYTFAGQLGYFGMNQHGVANYANAVYDCQSRPGLPHYPLKRLMLEQRTVQDCVELFRRHPQCSAANTIVCDGEGDIADIEARPEGMALYAGDHSDAIVHTNHYLSAEFRPLETGSLPDSFARHSRMTEMVRRQWGEITVESIKAMLADHQGDPAAICRHGHNNWHTTSGHIAEPLKGLLHLRRGHGCTGVWETFEV